MPPEFSFRERQLIPIPEVESAYVFVTSYDIAPRQTSALIEHLVAHPTFDTELHQAGHHGPFDLRAVEPKHFVPTSLTSWRVDLARELASIYEDPIVPADLIQQATRRITDPYMQSDECLVLRTPWDGSVGTWACDSDLTPAWPFGPSSHVLTIWCEAVVIDRDALTLTTVAATFD